MNNYAYIDGQNLHSGVSAQRWKLDHKKFREYLREELDVTKAFIFIGFMEEYQDLYNALQEAGFILFFKPLIRYDDGQIKGNVDADMVLKVMIDVAEYDQAVIVSGDGDFSGLIRHLATKNKLKKVLIPNSDTYSSLFKRMDEFDTGYFVFLKDLRNTLQYRPAHRQHPVKTDTSLQPVIEPKLTTAEPTSRTQAPISGRGKSSEHGAPASRPARPIHPKRHPKAGGQKRTADQPRKKPGVLLPKKKAEANLLSAIEESNIE